MAEEKEYGRIVVLLKDGTEGSALAITREVLFGRDKSADIRIKLNSVSRQHASITIKNGQCFLKHLSQTNPTRINGVEAIDEVLLKNRDEISIGERKFIFETVTDTMTTEEPQGVLKAVALDSIDDCITVDSSRNNIDKRRRASVSAKNPATSTLAATLMKDTLVRSKTETKPSSTVSLPIQNNSKPPGSVENTADGESAPPPKPHLKIGLPTPVKKAIQSKRKSISFDLEKLQEIAKPQFVPPAISDESDRVLASSSTTSSTSSSTTTTSTTTAAQSSLAIDIALDRVIEQHQRRLEDELQVLEGTSNLESAVVQPPPQVAAQQTTLPLPTNLQTPHTLIKPEANEFSVMKTPLKREIHSRRITRSAVKILETSDSPLLTIVPRPPLELMSPLPAQTPIRKSTRKSTQGLQNNAQSDSIEQDNTPIESPAVEPPLTRRVTRQSMKTPLKNAIQSRRKSLVTVVETLDKVLDDPIVEPERSVLKTPLKKAIQARRKSYAAQVEALDKLALTEELQEPNEEKEVEEDLSIAPCPVPSSSPSLFDSSSVTQLQSNDNQIDSNLPNNGAPRILTSPLKRAIELRRKSLQAEVVALDKLIDEPEHPASSKNMRLSLKRAIHSRRKSLTKEVERLTVVENNLLETKEASTTAFSRSLVPPASLPKSLLDAIESRQFNLRAEVKILDEMAYLATKVELKSSTESTSTSTSTSTSSDNKQILQTPIRKVIQSRRKSYSLTNNEKEVTSTAVPMDRILHTPLRKAIQSRRKSLIKEITILQDSLAGNQSVDSFSDAATSIDVGLTFPTGYNNLHENESNFLQSPFANDMGIEYEANQLCSRLSIASCASSIGRYEEISNQDDALAEALEYFLEQPEAFYSPRRCSFASSRKFQGENILSSIEKKGSEITGSLDPEMIADIMLSITDEELGMIDDYSKQLVLLTGMEDEEAYARCLDAYIQGVEVAIRKNNASLNLIQSETNESVESSNPLTFSTPSTPFSSHLASSTTAVSTTPAILSTPVASCHATPDQPKIECFEQKNLDLQLIMTYADDLEYSANLRPEIAYGIALDTYLADPISFRKNVKAMKVDPSTPIEWVEYDYDNHDNDNDNDNDNVYDCNYKEAQMDANQDEIDNEEKHEKDYCYDGETENEGDDDLISKSIPIMNLPSPISEERERERGEGPETATEEERERKEEGEMRTADCRDLENDSDRLVTGPTTPVIDTTRGRKRKVTIPPLESNNSIENVEVPSEVIVPETPGKKRGRPTKSKKTENEMTNEGKEEESTTKRSRNEREEESEGVSKTGSEIVVVTELKEKPSKESKKTNGRGRRKVVKDFSVDLEEEIVAEKSSTVVTAAKSKGNKRKASKKIVIEETDDNDLEEAIAILCDGCDQEYFVDEVGLSSIPEGDWFCRKCEAKNVNKENAKPETKKRNPRNKTVSASTSASAVSSASGVNVTDTEQQPQPKTNSRKRGTRK